MHCLWQTEGRWEEHITMQLGRVKIWGKANTDRNKDTCKGGKILPEKGNPKSKW